LTLAIMAALIVEAAGHRFAIPQYSVIELVRTGKAKGHQVELINETAVLRLRDKLLPLLDLAQLLGLEGDQAMFERLANNALTVVVIQVGGCSACWSTACSAPRRSWSSRCRICYATSASSPATLFSATAASS
jgi:chemotaxis protein histidine kinase CheA